MILLRSSKWSQLQEASTYLISLQEKREIFTYWMISPTLASMAVNRKVRLCYLPMKKEPSHVSSHAINFLIHSKIGGKAREREKQPSIDWLSVHWIQISEPLSKQLWLLQWSEDNDETSTAPLQAWPLHLVKCERIWALHSKAMFINLYRGIFWTQIIVKVTIIKATNCQSTLWWMIGSDLRS